MKRIWLGLSFLAVFVLSWTVVVQPAFSQMRPRTDTPDTLKKSGSYQVETQKGVESARRTVIGYTTNLPKEWLGFCLYKANPNKFGFYLDFKMNPAIPSENGTDYYKNIDVYQAEQWGDQLLSKKVGWFSLNGALSRFLGNRFALYGGAGFSYGLGYRQYYDEFHILGDHGRYWIDDDASSGAKLNLLGGVIALFHPQWSIQLGGEFKPPGVTLGIGRVISFGL